MAREGLENLTLEDLLVEAEEEQFDTGGFNPSKLGTDFLDNLFQDGLPPWEEPLRQRGRR